MADATTAPSIKQGAKLEKEWIEVELGLDKEKVIKNSNEYFALTKEFDTEKKYMFELANEASLDLHPVVQTSNAGRNSFVLPRKRFKPKQNLILSSQVVWNGQRRNVRYYAGCTTIFVDKQPNDKDIIEQAKKSTPVYFFIDGKLGWNGYERMLLLFMNICSWNIDSPFRTKTADGIFKSVNADSVANETTSRIDQMEEAMKLAREASEIKMRIHAKYLEIPDTDYDSGNELTEKEIRALYRQSAADNPKHFIESYGNRALEIKYYIDTALQSGTISNKSNPNKATWRAKNTIICDISGLKSHDAIALKLFEFSQSEDGAEFLVQLKALYEK